ncbi:MAG: hypothetical protein ACHBN1_23835 [Heteroscytonema crispum UTEX LB 1556]
MGDFFDSGIDFIGYQGFIPACESHPNTQQNSKTIPVYFNGLQLLAWNLQFQAGEMANSESIKFKFWWYRFYRPPRLETRLRIAPKHSTKLKNNPSLF